MEQMHVEGIEFMGEQKGAPESRFESSIMGILQSEKDVIRAYLARVRYEDGTGSVALCLRASTNNQQPIAQEIAAVFSEMFSNHQHLDILFLSRAQELDLMKVCRPFFGRFAEER